MFSSCGYSNELGPIRVLLVHNQSVIDINDSLSGSEILLIFIDMYSRISKDFFTLTVFFKYLMVHVCIC